MCPRCRSQAMLGRQCIACGFSHDDPERREPDPEERDVRLRKRASMDVI